MKRKKVFSRDNRFVGEDLRRGMWWEDEEGTESVENPVNSRAGSRLLLTVQVQVGKMEYGKRGMLECAGIFFGKSHLENLMRRGQSVRDGGLRKRRGSGVRAGSRSHLFHTLVTIQPNTAGRSE